MAILTSKNSGGTGSCGSPTRLPCREIGLGSSNRVQSSSFSGERLCLFSDSDTKVHGLFVILFISEVSSAGDLKIKGRFLIDILGIIRVFSV